MSDGGDEVLWMERSRENAGAYAKSEAEVMAAIDKAFALYQESAVGSPYLKHDWLHLTDSQRAYWLKRAVDAEKANKS